MALFDDIIIPRDLLPIPENEKQLFHVEHIFYTQDLDCLMETAKITDKKLMYMVFDGSMIDRKNRKWKQIFLNTLNFYDLINDKFWEFKAEFKNGLLNGLFHVEH